jgi:lipopolysaccharide biosynthesis glycosyltransferase
LEIEDNYIAGTIDPNFMHWMANESDKLSDLKFDKSEIKAYICSGVMLMNLKIMRENKIVDKLMEEIKNNHLTVDQDALNIVCRDKIKVLSFQ